MSRYLKIEYNATTSDTGLKEALIFIGKHYVTNINVDYQKNHRESYYLKKGINYIAKLLGRFNRSAIKCMIFPKNMKGKENKEWWFNIKLYSKAYKLILQKLLETSHDEREEVLALLNKLYKSNPDNPNIQRMCSDALIYWQMRMLNVNKVNPDYFKAKNSLEIYEKIKSVDKPIPKRESYE